MNIKILKTNDFSYANDLASLHAKNIIGKSSNIGVEFLSKIYQTFLQDRNIRIWILFHNEKVVGFLCGCIRNKEIYKKFLFKNFSFLIFLFLRNILNLSFIKNAYGLIILLLTAKNFSSGNAELLSIAISKNFRNKYYGKKLIRKLEFYLKNKNKKEYIVKLESNNKRAINFYLSNKFKQTLKTNYPLYEVIYLKKKTIIHNLFHVSFLDIKHKYFHHTIYNNSLFLF